MATGGGWAWDETFKASEDMDSYTYHAVKTGSVAEEVTLSAAEKGPVPIGVLQNNPRQGAEATVRVKGRTQVWASVGTAITVGDFLSCGSIGHLEIAAGSVAQAIALEALASGSAVIEVLWFGPQHALGQTIDNTP